MNCNCFEIKSRLSDYADGELSKRERREVQTHLAECAECRKALGEFRWIDRLLTESLREAPVERWLTLPGDEPVAPQSASQRRRWAQATLAAAAAGLLALAAWSLVGNRQSERRPPDDERVAAKAAVESPPVEVAGEQDRWTELHAEIEREASAAQLAASAEILAAQPGANEYAGQSWRLLAEMFPETQAGREAARRVESIGGPRRD